MPEKLLPLSAVEDIVGFRRSHIYVLISRHQFPAPVAIGTRRRWKQSDVQNWVNEKIQQSANHPAQGGKHAS